jgi:hypothetical protein
VVTLEAVEGGHRAKSVQAAPGVPADHRGGQALGPVLYERPAGALLKGGLPSGIRRAIDTLGPGLEPSEVRPSGACEPAAGLHMRKRTTDLRRARASA